jgi:glycosyltransferase involved in cell wall biosynthesis
MKIALINDSFLRGRGADQVVFELAQRLGENNEVDVITAEADFPETNFKIKKVNAQRLLTGTWRDFLFFQTAGKFKKAASGYDVINIHHATLASAFRRFSNAIITYHGSPFVLLGENRFRRFARSAVNKFGVSSLKNHQKVIAISEYIKQELIKNKIPVEKIEVIYDGVGDEFRPVSPPASPRGERLGGPTHEDQGYMFFAGRHYKHKRIDKLIRLSAQLGFRLKVAGDGPETENLKKLAKETKAPVEFLGRISDAALLSHYQKCSFFVSASVWEGFGLIFLEAARCAKLSVAYKEGSIPEVIEDKKGGFLAENEEEFKRYVKILIDNEVKRSEMGQNALEFSQKFSWDSTVKKYLEVFNNIKG